MHICRSLAPSLVLMAALVGAEPAVAPGVPAPASEATAPDAAVLARINALIDTAIAHGLPDGTGAVLLKGSLVVIEDKPKPGADGTVMVPRVHPHGRLGDQSEEGGQRAEDDLHITTTYDGVHARLKDGSYLVNLRFLKRASATVAITAEGLVELKPTELRTSLPAEDELSEAELAMFYKGMSARQLDGMKAIMRWSGLLENLQYQRTAQVAAVLIRVGVPDAHELIWAEMNQELGGQFTQEVRPIYLTSQDTQHGLWLLNKRSQKYFAALQGDQPAEPMMIPDFALDGYLRQGLLHWFRDQIVAPAAGLTEAKAIAGLSALLGGTVDPDQREELRLFTEYAALPATVAADAPLAERLVRWSPAELPMGMSLEVFERLPADQRDSMGYQPASGPAITEADRAELFALLDDQRASAWIDPSPAWGMMGGGLTPRTRGDNALRALARQFGFDPRLLVGRDPFVGWTAAERSATAQALQSWFKAHGSEPVADLLATVVAGLPAGRAAQLIATRPKGEHPALIAAVVTSWKSAQPSGPAAEGLGEMLALAKNDPTAITVVNAWPVAGDQRLLLAAWHDLHGDGKPLDALIPEVFAAPTESAFADNGFGPTKDPNSRVGLLVALANRPTPARLALLKIQLADPTSPTGQAIIQGALGKNWQAWDCPGLRALLGHQRDPVRRALGFSLTADLLANRNPLPPGQVEFQPWGVSYGNLNFTSANAGFQAYKVFTPAADLRWCDLAAYAVAGNSWDYRGDHGERPEDLTFDLAATLPERDKQIAAMRLAMDPVFSAACAAAGLPKPTGAVATETSPSF